MGSFTCASGLSIAFLILAVESMAFAKLRVNSFGLQTTRGEPALYVWEEEKNTTTNKHNL